MPPNENIKGTGSLADVVTQNEQTVKNKPDAAAIIDASGNGLQGLAALAGAITGNAPQTTIINEANDTPAQSQNQNLMIGLGVGGALLVLVFLIMLSQNGKNGTATK